jgi:hypothetical protein
MRWRLAWLFKNIVGTNLGTKTHIRNPKMKLENKVCVITGGNSGIGLPHAVCLPPPIQPGGALMVVLKNHAEGKKTVPFFTQ